jgi:hypothetical protein
MVLLLKAHFDSTSLLYHANPVILWQELAILDHENGLACQKRGCVPANVSAPLYQANQDAPAQRGVIDML